MDVVLLVSGDCAAGVAASPWPSRVKSSVLAAVISANGSNSLKSPLDATERMRAAVDQKLTVIAAVIVIAAAQNRKF